jgi:hypothetical protein
MFALLKDPGGLDGDRRRDDRLAFLSSVVGRPVDTSDDLTSDDVDAVIGQLQSIAQQPADDRPLTVAELVEHGRTLRGAR